MANSRRSSNASAICRIEWRPSRLLCGALASLGVLGAVACLLSEAPIALAMPMALASVVIGCTQMRREIRRPVRHLVVTAAGVEIDGMRVEAPRFHWRGPLVALAWTAPDGRKHRLHWWPDTLDAAGRRELKLAMPRPESRASTATMAP